MLLKNQFCFFFVLRDMKFANIAEKITYPNNADCMYLYFLQLSQSLTRMKSQRKHSVCQIDV